MLKEEISKYLSPLLSSSKLRAKLFHSLVFSPDKCEFELAVDCKPSVEM